MVPGAPKNRMTEDKAEDRTEERTEDRGLPDTIGFDETSDDS